MFRPQTAIIRCLVLLKLSQYIKYTRIKYLFIHTICKCGVSCLIYLSIIRQPMMAHCGRNMLLDGGVKFLNFK
jgi:hypothetical protein